MIKLRINILLLILFFASPLLSQDQNKIQLDYANTLFNTNQYFDAVTEYKRLLFFNPSPEYLYELNYKIGLSYKAGAKFDEAIKYFTSSEMNASDNQQKYDSKIQIVRSNILRKTTDRALQLIDEMEKSTLFNDKLDSLNYWRGWAYMFADDWENASKAFAAAPFGKELQNQCDFVLNRKVSVTFAKVISYILPGSGQIYTGNYLSGLMSLSYNILFGYLTVNSFVEDRVFDGAATGALLWLRFYRGNIQNAGNFAEEKNLEIANTTLRYIQSNYQGIKP